MFTQLTNRTLWYDGTSSYSPDRFQDVLKVRDVKYVSHITDEVKQFNRCVDRSERVSVRHPDDVTLKAPSWIVQVDDAESFIIHLIDTHSAKYSTDTSFTDREDRLLSEISLFAQHGLIGVLQAINSLINRLSSANVVWGVGRGSSVSSYVLHVIGVHDVDSFLYQLDIHDFLAPRGNK